MFSIAELFRIIESGFLPLACTCTISPSGYLSVKVIDPRTGRVELMVDGVSTQGLTSSRAVSNLIGELRSEMAVARSMSASGYR